MPTPICFMFDKQLAARFFPCLSEYDKQNLGENGNNSDDDEQFNQRKRGSFRGGETGTFYIK